MEPDFEKMVKQWKGGPFVPRTDVQRFSGGMLNPGTLANLDSRGEGPPRTRYGKKIFYPVDELVMWMRQRWRNQHALQMLE